MLIDVQENHPRPIMSRADWQDLGGTWQFAHDDGDAGLAQRWTDDPAAFTGTIVVPYPPESPASGVHEPGYHPVVWYRRVFRHSVPATGRRLLLHFGAVDYRADVWVNGRHAVSHEGGQTPFRADITDLLDEGGEQVVVVRVVDDPHDLEQPRGKQDWEPRPHVIWYERTTGIWQPVWLEEVPDTHATAVRWTPVTPGVVDLEVRLARRRPGTTRISARITLDGRVVADDAYTVDGTLLRRRITLEDPALTAEPHLLEWSPDRPTLCPATITVADVEGSGASHAGPDEVHSYVGFRTVSTDDRAFLLNGRPHPLRLALAQGYWPESHLAAPSGEALRAEVEIVKQLGFNGVRVHQKVEDPRFLYWCDRLGVLVLADNAASFTFTRRSVSRTIRDWTEIVDRDASHPCIVGWTAFNESWGVPDVAASRAEQDAVRAVHHLLKALDPSRLAIGNDGWEYVVGDLLGVHDYTHDPARITQRYGEQAIARKTVEHGRPAGRALTIAGDDPAVPIVLSEFGGITYAPHIDGTWAGYGGVDSADELVDRLADLVGAANAALAAGALAGFCYTQLSDTAQERNGLVTEDRKPKADPEMIARIVRGEPRR